MGGPHPRPVLQLELLDDRRFSVTAAGLSLGVFGLMGTLFVQTQFLQFDIGYSSLQAGLRILPLAGMLELGAGTLIPTATNSIVDSVPQGNSGVGSASNVVAFQFGGALGVAVVGSALSTRSECPSQQAPAPERCWPVAAALRFSAAWTSSSRSPPEPLCSERSSCSHDFAHTVGRSPELPRRCPAQAQRRRRTRRAE